MPAATAEPATTVHPFEAAGMGLAPFRLTSEDAAHKALRLGGGFGCCDACGKIGLSRIFYVRSADGVVSSVGANCVAKIAGDDPALADRVESIVKADRRAASSAKKIARAAEVSAVIARLDDPSVREKLAGLPHPKAWAGGSLLSWAEWMAQYGGNKSRDEVAKAIEMHGGK